MLKLLTARSRVLRDALTDELRRITEKDPERDCYIAVPRQLTLLTERTVLAALAPEGSFHLHVISPERLCARIFGAAGMPEGIRVDERGRVLLVRRAMELCRDDLRVYGKAIRRAGFAERCASQLEELIQAGVDAETLRGASESLDGMLALKALDLADILDKYTALSRGLYRDGDTELTLAAQRMPDAAFIKNSSVLFYGLDRFSGTMLAFILAAARETDTCLLLMMPGEENAADIDCFQRTGRVCRRLEEMCRASGIPFEIERLSKRDTRHPELVLLEEKLFAVSAEKYAGEPERISLTPAMDIREECMLAAARARSHALRGGRYGDIRLLVSDPNTYRPFLEEAFRLCEVPLFLSDSRSVARMGVCECLLTSVLLLARSFRQGDVLALLSGGYTALTADEAARLGNYAVCRGIDKGLWLKPFRRGSEAEAAESERLRLKLISPLLKLREALRNAETLPGQLAAVFTYLKDLGAYDRCLRHQKLLRENGMADAANEISQAWNRIITTMDQTAELMDEKKLPLIELYRCLADALAAAVIKPLPQSDDAVYAQSACRAMLEPAKIVMFLGMSDARAVSADSLLTDRQHTRLAGALDKDLGPDDAEAALLKRAAVKCTLSLVSDHVYFSYPSSTAEGEAVRAGNVISELRRLFPDLKEDGGIFLRERQHDLFVNAPSAALIDAVRSVAALRDGKRPGENEIRTVAALKRAGETDEDLRRGLERAGSVFRAGAADPVSPKTAERLYNGLSDISITRLERFASCPFLFFAENGLRPKPVEQDDFGSLQKGDILHAAVQEFIRASRSDIGKMDNGEAVRRMDEILLKLAHDPRYERFMQEGALVRAEFESLRENARNCAAAMNIHMRGSSFVPEYTERDFGGEGDAGAAEIAGMRIIGRIDRADTCVSPDAVRIIDYKLSSKEQNLGDCYYGFSQQLPIYLGTALRQTGLRPAGVYYLGMEDGIISIDEIDPAKIEKKRADEMRLKGILPSDDAVLSAMTPDPGTVFKQTTGPFASDGDYRRLVRHAERKAEEQISAIRSGEVGVKPAKAPSRHNGPCEYCRYASACLFDVKAGDTVAEFRKLSSNEVLERLAREYGPMPGEALSNEEQA